ncbi:hypothetical protein F8388_019772 [Cannabis sativa]|uniref:Brf1 TBP-binding domain-containing protein n=1 Tax=Cannabis sativa TaxID=3483 RepID=A0A7J6EXT5_CANSA|nr:hypothetical protein F8388_019772 [Cannabis sativa]
MDDKKAEQLESTVVSNPMRKVDTQNPTGAKNGDANSRNLYSSVSDAELIHTDLRRILCPKIMVRVFRYLNSNKVASYKRVIWETMNMDYQKIKTFDCVDDKPGDPESSLNGTSQKRAKTAKKVDPAKVVKPSQKKNNEKKLSSKINYDMLNKLEQRLDLKGVSGHSLWLNMFYRNYNDSVDHVQEIGFGEGGRTLDNEKFNSEAYSSGETNNNDFEHEKLGSEEEGDAIQDYYAITDYGMDDDGYGHYEEHDYEEYYFSFPDGTASWDSADRAGSSSKVLITSNVHEIYT